MDLEAEEKLPITVLEEKLFKTAINEMSTPLMLSSTVIKEVDEHKYLYRTCCTVWNDSGIGYIALETSDLKRGTIDLKSESIENQVALICERAKVQYQKVSLETYWWKRDGGSMLCFFRSESHPITLAWTLGHYYIIDNIKGSSEKVNASKAAEILPYAYVFFPTWTEETFTILSMQKIIMKGLEAPILKLLGYMLICVVLGALFPITNKVFFDHVIPNIDVSLFFQLIIGLTGIGFSIALFNYFSGLLFLKFEGITETRQQAIQWDHLFKMPSSFFHEHTIGDLLQRMAIVGRMKELLGQNSLKTASAGLIGIAYIIPMAYFNLSFALVVLCFAFFFVFVTVFAVPKVYKLQLKNMRLMSSINTTELEIFANVGQLRLFQAEKRAFAYWSRTFTESMLLRKKFGNIEAMLKSMMASMTNVFYVAFFISFYFFMVSGEKSTMSIGTFISFQAALVLFGQSLSQILGTSFGYAELFASWHRIKSMWVNVSELASPGTVRVEIKGNISVKDVSFSYEPSGREYLKDVSLDVNEGDFIAIKGPSGCGKSTLLRLLSNMEKPNSGKVFYEGVEISDIQPTIFKKQVSTILQTSNVITGTLQDNILCGRKGTLEQVKEAIRLSDFEEAMELFPMGLQTLLITGGKLLSAGQKQKLLLARALLNQPKVLILDEATSAIYLESQEKIFRSLREKKMTIITVTHDEFVLSIADRVFIL